MWVWGIYTSVHTACAVCGGAFHRFPRVKAAAWDTWRGGYPLQSLLSSVLRVWPEGWVPSMWLLLDTWHPPAFAARGPFQEMDTMEGSSPQDSHPQKGKKNPKTLKK